MKRKAIASLIAACMLLWTAAPSFAAAETKDISASYSGITLYIDLKPVALLDANGNPVDPFIAGGTTYLPVRAISEALGMDVSWEADTKSIRISEKSEAAVEADVTPAADEPDGKTTAPDGKTTAPPEKSEAVTDEKADAEAPAKDAATDEKAAAEAPAKDAATDEKAGAEPTEEAAAEEPADEATAAAESFVGTKTLSATFDDISIYINNEELSPKDAAGNEVAPFIAGGTTYLPVRAVAEALGLSVSWDGATKSVYLGEQPEKAAESAVEENADNAAYAKYEAAAKALEAAGSYASDLSGDISMTIDGKKTEAKMSGEIKVVNHSDTDIEFAAKTTAAVAGVKSEVNTYYRNGFLYMEVADEKLKLEMPIEQALKEIQKDPGLQFEASAVKAQSIDGDTIKLTFDGSKLADAANATLDKIDAIGTANASYDKMSDVECTVILDDEGALKSIRTLFSTDLTEGDTKVSAAYDLTTAYTQVGGVSITAPADLASYKDSASETK
ncbi:MAG: copper amine oxidase N-terminal domain-containing protein [Clostridiales Family XIII bacterium]|jgi:hypothetical protein|nr:copper amine oxidase N-terminal domain-containing protein [Clostridiales Family XIII bacterium]